MSQNRPVLYLLAGILFLSGEGMLNAQGLGAGNASTVAGDEKLSEDELWQKLNELAGKMLLYVRQVSTGRMLINRGLTADFEHPYDEGETLNKQQLLRLTTGAYTTMADPPPGFSTHTEYNLAKSFSDYVKNGSNYEKACADVLGTDTGGAPAGSSGFWNKIKDRWGSKKSALEEAGDYAHDTTLQRYLDYFDANWDKLGEKGKCCVESRLNEVKKGLTYTQFKAGLHAPKLNPSYALKPAEKARLVVLLTYCIPPGDDILDGSAAKQVLDAFRNAAEKASEYYYELLEKVVDSGEGAKYAADRAKEIIVDLAVEQGQNLFKGSGNEGSGNEGGGNATTQSFSGARPAPGAKIQLGRKADAVVILNPQEGDLPIQFAGLRVVDGKLIVPRPFVGNYDIYLYLDGIRPVLIKDVAVEKEEQKAFSVRGLRPLGSSAKPGSPATVHPSPDTPPEAPYVAPPAGCPCKPYRIRIISEMKCPSAEMPLRYERLRFEGEGHFDLFDSDTDFSTRSSTKYLGPITVPMRSQRQFFHGTLDGGEFSYSPSSALLRGDLSVTLELSKEGNAVCLELRDEIGKNQSMQLTHTLRDVATGHVIKAELEERMFMPAIAYPLQMETKHGCGLPGKVSIRGDSSNMPAELLAGCTYSTEVLIEPVR